MQTRIPTGSSCELPPSLSFCVTGFLQTATRASWTGLQDSRLGVATVRAGVAVEQVPSPSPKRPTCLN